jgi:hypothetical protein
MGWRRGWGRRRAVGSDAAAHDLRGGQRRAVSGDRLDGGHGGVVPSDERGQKRNGGFRHGLLGQHCREWHGLSGQGGGSRNADTTRPDSAYMVRCACEHGCVAATRRRRADRQAWRGKRRLTGGSLMSVISELKFTPRRK